NCLCAGISEGAESAEQISHEDHRNIKGQQGEPEERKPASRRALIKRSAEDGHFCWTPLFPQREMVSQAVYKALLCLRGFREINTPVLFLEAPTLHARPQPSRSRRW